MDEQPLIERLQAELSTDGLSAGAVRVLLRKLLHELANDVGSIGIDVYTLGQANTRLQEAARAGNLDQIRTQSKTITTAVRHLKEGSEGIQRLIRNLEQSTLPDD